MAARCSLDACLIPLDGSGSEHKAPCCLARLTVLYREGAGNLCGHRPGCEAVLAVLAMLGPYIGQGPSQHKDRAKQAHRPTYVLRQSGPSHEPSCYLLLPGAHRTHRPIPSHIRFLHPSKTSTFVSHPFLFFVFFFFFFLSLTADVPRILVKPRRRLLPTPATTLVTPALARPQP